MADEPRVIKYFDTLTVAQIPSGDEKHDWWNVDEIVHVDGEFYLELSHEGDREMQPARFYHVINVNGHRLNVHHIVLATQGRRLLLAESIVLPLSAHAEVRRLEIFEAVRDFSGHPTTLHCTNCAAFRQWFQMKGDDLPGREEVERKILAEFSPHALLDELARRLAGEAIWCQIGQYPP